MVSNLLTITPFRTDGNSVTNNRFGPALNSGYVLKAPPRVRLALVASSRFHYHQGIPIVSVACVNCGHLINFAAGVIGLKPDPPSAEEVPAIPTRA